MKWTDEAWQAASGIYESIIRLPFLQELAAGTLPYEKFHFYISQDSLYLDDYCSVLSHIASRLDDMDDTATFLGFALDGVAVEKGLHAGYKPDRSMGKSPACLFYTSLLRAQAYSPVAVEAAAILPCFWIYMMVGRHVLSIANLEGNPYRQWIECYSDEAFDISNDKALEVCNRLAESATPEIREQMTRIFVDCSRMEWLFWESAYNQRMWQEEIK